MAQMNGIAPVKAGEGWDGAAGLVSPCPCRPQLRHFLFPIYLLLRRSGMKLKSPTEGAQPLPAKPPALIWEYEINMQPLIPIKLPPREAREGLADSGCGENTTEGTESVDLGQVADGLSSVVDAFFFPPRISI